MCGSGQAHHKTPFFSSKSHISGSVRSYITRHCEGPGEQPGMTHYAFRKKISSPFDSTRLAYPIALHAGFVFHPQ